MTIVFSAPSGAGKTTLIQKVLAGDPGFSFSVSTTSRPLRGQEVEGKDYYFVSPDEFRLRIDRGCFAEWALVHGNYYGTEKKEIDRICSREIIPILDIDVQGASIVRKTIENAVFIFIFPPSIGVLRGRLMARKTDSPEQIALRLQNAKREMISYVDYDYVVVNDDIELAAAEIKSIISAEKCRTARILKKIRNIMEENDDNTA